MSFFRESDLTPRQVLEGITLRSVSGNGAMMTFFEFEPGSLIPMHRHRHEQITYIIEGEMELTLDGETRVLRAGDGVLVQSNQEHGAKILSARTKAVDAWHPVREDYL